MLDQKKTDQIRQILKRHPSGISISALSSGMNANRNLIAKYLDMLVISGRVERQTVGMAKVYRLSRRVPLSALYEYLSDLVLLLDPEGHITRASGQLLALLGEKTGNLAGKKIGKTGNPFLDSIPSLSAKGSDPSAEVAAEMTCMLGGEMHYFSLQQVPVVFEDGQPGIALIIREIHHSRKFANAADPDGRRYREVADDLPEFVVRFIPDGTLTFANNAFCRLMPDNSAGPAGHSFFSFIPGEDQARLEPSLRALDPEHPVGPAEFRVIDPSGQLRWYRWTVRALFDNRGNLHEYQGVGRDSTGSREEKEAAGQLTAAIRFLHRKAWEFTNLPDDADLFGAIGRGAKELLPSAAILLFTYDAATDTITVKEIAGEREREVLRACRGMDWKGWSFKLTYAMALQSAKTGRFLKVPGNMYIASMGQIPEPVCRELETRLDIGDMYCIGMPLEDDLPAAAVILMKKGDPLPDTDLLETYFRLAALALERKDRRAGE